MNTKLRRGAGVLLHITSLPSDYGIGDLGENAYDFISFLAQSGQRYWQILPLGPDGENNSPYKCSSSFAGNDMLISPDKLAEYSLLSKDDLTQCNLSQEFVNYDRVREYKDVLFSKAYCNFKQSSSIKLLTEMADFIKENDYWLSDYVLYKAASKKYKSRDWSLWEDGIRNREDVSLEQFKEEMADDLDYYTFIQFIFFKQWSELKAYANESGIQIIGDIPIYVDYESADVWSNQELFDLDEKGLYKNISGYPPDFFSEDGQVWGNPLYNWEKHEKYHYIWWINRIKHNLKLVNYLRIDHFRGFESYYAIPNETRRARDGVFIKGPGYKFLDVLQNNLKDMPIIVEDLGNTDRDVEKLRDTYDLPGMRILQMAFEIKEAAGYNPSFLPHNYIPNTIAYTGTHDNMTVKQWFKDDNTDHRAKENFKQYINKEQVPNTEFDICWEMIRLLYASVASVAVVPLQDILEVGEEGRMNIPGTEDNNWRWRFHLENLTNKISNRLKNLVDLYER